MTYHIPDNSRRVYPCYGTTRGFCKRPGRQTHAHIPANGTGIQKIQIKLYFRGQVSHTLNGFSPVCCLTCSTSFHCLLGIENFKL